jgi:hypothetical protein
MNDNEFNAIEIATKPTAASPIEPVVSSELCKCGCRSCDDSRSNVHIFDPVNKYDWGEWDYCENAIQADIKEGFTVTRI